MGFTLNGSLSLGIYPSNPQNLAKAKQRSGWGVLRAFGIVPGRENSEFSTATKDSTENTGDQFRSIPFFLQRHGLDSIKANAAKWSIIDRVNKALALFALWWERWVFAPKIMTDFIELFDDLPDPRIISSKKHKLIDNSFITIAAVRYGCAEREEIEGYGDKKGKKLPKYIGLPGCHGHKHNS